MVMLPRESSSSREFKGEVLAAIAAVTNQCPPMAFEGCFLESQPIIKQNACTLDYVLLGVAKEISAYLGGEFCKNAQTERSV